MIFRFVVNLNCGDFVKTIFGNFVQKSGFCDRYERFAIDPCGFVHFQL